MTKPNRPPPRQLNIDWLRALVLVSAHGGVASAARRAARPARSLGYHVRCLEAEIGVPLFRFKRPGAELTEAGRHLLTYATRLIDLHDDALMSTLALGATGMVRFGMPQDLEARVTPLLARFCRVHSGIKVAAQVASSETLRDGVDAERLDVALTLLEAGSGAALAGYPLAWLGARTPERAADGRVRLVLCDPPCTLRALALETLERAGIAHEIVLTSPSLAGLWIAVEAGLGITLRPAVAVPSGVAALEGLPAVPPVQLHIRIRAGDLPVAALRLREWLVDAFAGASHPAD